MLIIGAEAALPAGAAWCVSVVALTREDIPVPESPRLSEHDTELPCAPLLCEMGGYLLTYALY